MKKFLGLLVMAMFVAGFTIDGWALTFTGQAPKVSGGGSSQTDFDNAFDSLLADINTNVVGKYESQKKMAKAFADANAFAASNTSMWAFQGYDLFQVMVNLGASTQLPTFNVGDIEAEVKKIEDEGDAEVGVGFSANVNVGINLKLISGLTGIDIFRKMTADLRFMTYEYDIDSGDYNLSYDYLVLGLGVHYKLIEPASIGFGLFQWRGVTLGSGLIYQRNNIILDIALDEKTENDIGATTADLVIDPSVEIGMEVSTFTIPLEIATSFRLLYALNLGVGAGVDVTFGSNDVTARSGGGVNLVESGGVTQDEPGYITGDSGSSGNTTVINPKLMASLGLGVGPAVINLSGVYYIPSGGALALSAGVVW